MLTVENFESLIAGEGNEVTDAVKSTAKTIYEAYNTDVMGLKVTNAQLKEEKTAIKKSYDADIAKFANAEKDFQNQISQLQEEVKNAGTKDSSEAKKFYETQLAQVESGYKSQVSERDKKISEYEARIKDFERKGVLQNMEKAFNDAVRKTKVNPAAYDILKNYILGESGSKFTQHDTEDGEKLFWATDGSGDSIDVRLTKFLTSDEGKMFIPFGNGGSAAEGGTPGSGSMQLSRDAFEKLPPAMKASKMKEGYKII